MQGGRRHVDEISQHMDVDLVSHRGNLDAGHELHARFAARDRRRFATAYRIMVGDGERRDAGGPGTGHQLRRTTSSVRRGRVRMKVDHRADF